jgi:pimeloyl-ACP methyl ester carboxylesterase
MADRAFRPTLLAKWRQALPHAQVITLDGVGHWPHEEAPDEVGRALAAFVR